MKLPNDFDFYNAILWNRDGSTSYYQLRFLSFDFFEQDFDYIMFLKFDFPQNLTDSEIRDLKIALSQIYLKHPDAFVVLTHRKKTPLYTQSNDEFIYSFSCSYIHFRSVIKKWKNTFAPEKFLFNFLNQVFEQQSGFNQILVKQIPIEDQNNVLDSSCDVVVPHRGDNTFLDTALFYLSQIEFLNVFVGIDQDIEEEILGLKSKYSTFKFFAFQPNPVGPYVIRNALIDKGRSKLIFFQDSDDIPCADRFAKISDFMLQSGCQLCGSHEVRIDYFDKTVRAHRFPLNVSRALAVKPGHPLLHPASAISRDAFYSNGKLSEERIFGNDTKFLLHSFFILNNIGNIDEFLYIRRRRPDSLTTSPNTSIGSPARLKLQLSWNRDFEYVKQNILSVKDSNLTYKGPSFGVENTPI